MHLLLALARSGRMSAASSDVVQPDSVRIKPVATFGTRGSARNVLADDSSANVDVSTAAPDLMCEECGEELRIEPNIAQQGPLPVVTGSPQVLELAEEYRGFVVAPSQATVPCNQAADFDSSANAAGAPADEEGDGLVIRLTGAQPSAREDGRVGPGAMPGSQPGQCQLHHQQRKPIRRMDAHATTVGTRHGLASTMGGAVSGTSHGGGSSSSSSHHDQHHFLSGGSEHGAATALSATREETAAELGADATDGNGSARLAEQHHQHHEHAHHRVAHQEQHERMVQVSKGDNEDGSGCILQ